MLSSVERLRVMHMGLNWKLCILLIMLEVTWLGLYDTWRYKTYPVLNNTERC